MSGLHMNNVLHLWHEGLLRADLVVSAVPLDEEAFQKVPDRVDWYIDVRPAVSPDRPWSEILANASLPDKRVQPLFHPYRFAMMVVLSETLRVRAPGMMRLYNLARLAEWLEGRVVPREGEQSSPHFSESWEALQTWCELAVVLEPTMFSQVFRSQRIVSSGLDVIRGDFKQYEALLQGHWSRLADALRSIGEETLVSIHRRFCDAARELDPNREIHTLLHLLDVKRRERIHGTLGGCLHLLTVAEVIRRSAERALEIRMLEEDEAGAGGMFRDAKQALYGSDRLLDGGYDVRDMMRRLSLDYGLKARCYVEGATEYGAMRSALEGFPSISVIDLQGQVVERRRKGVAFAESLREDAKQKIYSYVLLDGDVGDNVRAVRKTAERDEFFGAFHVGCPDIEYENFSAAELAQIIWGFIQADEEMRRFSDEEGFEHADVVGLVGVCTSSRELFDALKKVPQISLSKGERWGEALMAHAARHPEREDGTERPLLALVRQVVHSTRVPYGPSVERFRVDPDTGMVVDRQ